MKPFENPEVATLFGSYPEDLQPRLLALRELVFATAASTEGVGAVEEALRWGQPAYLTPETGSGSTIRIEWKESSPREIALCFHCRTSLVAGFRERFPGVFQFDGNRRIVFGEGDPIPEEPLAECIAAALTYHLDRRAGGRVEGRSDS